MDGRSPYEYERAVAGDGAGNVQLAPTDPTNRLLYVRLDGGAGDLQLAHNPSGQVFTDGQPLIVAPMSDVSPRGWRVVGGRRKVCANERGRVRALRNMPSPYATIGRKYAGNGSGTVVSYSVFPTVIGCGNYFFAADVAFPWVRFTGRVTLTTDPTLPPGIPPTPISVSLGGTLFRAGLPSVSLQLANGIGYRDGGTLVDQPPSVNTVFSNEVFWRTDGKNSGPWNPAGSLYAEFGLFYQHDGECLWEVFCDFFTRSHDPAAHASAASGAVEVGSVLASDLAAIQGVDF